jgi:DNA-binding LytR/AlgR family response regulator
MVQGFTRVHISYIVNQKAIKAFKRRKKGGIILLHDGTEIPLSENKKADFLQLFA